MSTSRPTSALLAGFAMLSLTIGDSHAGNTASVPVGLLTFPVTNGTISAFGVPVLDLPKFTGFTTAVTANTLAVTGLTWTANQFVTAGPHFVTIRTGAQAGRTLRVTANTTNTLTLDTEDTALNTAGFAVTANTDAFELYAGDTLATLLGSTATSGILTSGVKAGTSTADADVIYIPSGAVWTSYYFSSTLGFWVLDGGSTTQNNVILYPDDGFLIFRNGTTGNLTNVTGRVPTSKMLSKFPGGTTNFIALRFPASATFGSLNFGAPGTWITGANETVADTVSVWNSAGYYWQSYYKNTINQWIEVGGDGSDQSFVTIPMGTSIQIDKRGTGTGAASFLGQILPYSF